jgi:proteasome lid subunit RPN8/RPN11
MFPLEKAIEHAAACYPMEACGLWIEKTPPNVSTSNDANIEFIPCGPEKVSKGKASHFSISPQKWLEAEREGTLKGIFHTHPDGEPLPSEQDLVGIESWGLPWLIMAWPSKEYNVFEPSRNPCGLLGRRFEYGTNDCYGLIRDYYGRLGVGLLDFGRAPKWEHEGQNLYLDNYARTGFVEVQDGPRPHDVLLFQIHAPVPNHGAIYLGDSRILHHLEGRLSARAVYGDFYQKATTHILRHKELL